MTRGTGSNLPRRGRHRKRTVNGELRRAVPARLDAGTRKPARVPNKAAAQFFLLIRLIVMPTMMSFSPASLAAIMMVSATMALSARRLVPSAR